MTPTCSDFKKLHVVGAGRAAAGIAHLLHQNGVSIGTVVCRSNSSALRAAALIGGGVAGALLDVVEDDSLLILGAPDESLEPLAVELARRMEDRDRRVANSSVLHLSGTMSSDVLDPLRNRGYSVGSMHPLFSFADRESPPRSLAGVVFALEGQPPALRHARQLADTLKARAVTIRTESKALYHAAASLLSNGLVALCDRATFLMSVAGVDRIEAREILTPLISATVDNLRAAGTPAALTGPIERGQTAVVEMHLKAVRRFAPRWLELIIEVNRAIVEVARAKGSIDDFKAAQLCAILDEAGGGP